MRNRAVSHWNQLCFVMENIYQGWFCFFFSFVGSPNSAIITPLRSVIRYLSYTSRSFKSAAGWGFLGYQLGIIILFMNILGECFIRQSNGHSFAKLMSLYGLEAGWTYGFIVHNVLSKYKMTVKNGIYLFSRRDPTLATCFLQSCLLPWHTSFKMILGRRDFCRIFFSSNEMWFSLFCLNVRKWNKLLDWFMLLIQHFQG